MSSVRIPSSPRAAAVALAVLAAACAIREDPRDAAGALKPDARELCRRTFRACAPPASFGMDTDVRRLSPRKLVQLAARLDVDDDLAESAAERLREVAATLDTSALIDLESALDDVATWSERCRCDRFRSQLEEKGVATLVAGRLPPRETRSPEHWVDAIVSRIDTFRKLRRGEARLAVVDASGESEKAAEAKVLEAQRDLCQTVHAARGPLSRSAFAAMLDAVYKKERASSGEGSAEAAKRMLDEVKDSAGCEPAPAP